MAFTGRRDLLYNSKDAPRAYLFNALTFISWSPTPKILIAQTWTTELILGKTEHGSKNRSKIVAIKKKLPCKKFLYYGYCMLTRVMKILSILCGWGVARFRQKQPKTAKFPEDFLKHNTSYTLMFQKIVIIKIFYILMILSKKFFSFFVHTQGTFFDQ